MRLSRLDGWPARSPADASPLASRPDTHGSGPTWIATPSSYRTLTDYSWPVSRRTTRSHGNRPTSWQRTHKISVTINCIGWGAGRTQLPQLGQGRLDLGQQRSAKGLDVSVRLGTDLKP